MITYTLQRKLQDHANTIGSLSTASKTFWTCEDTVRPAKIKGMTAIDAGTYRVIVNQSARFGRSMPLLVGVPKFEGVRIHWGNTSEDTEGCILLGTEYKKGYGILNSRIAFKQFFDLLVSDLMQDAVQITILNSES